MVSGPDQPEPRSPEPHSSEPQSSEPQSPEPQSPEPARHESTGLELAQQMARSLGASAKRRKKSTWRPRTDPQVSGARPDDRDPKRLSDAVQGLVEAKGWTTDINVQTLLARWGLLVGSGPAAHSKPEAYVDTVLTVRTDSTAWATQLRLLAPQLVAMLNDQLGDGTVTRVTVLGPDAPSWKRGRLSVRDGRGPRDTYG